MTPEESARIMTELVRSLGLGRYQPTQDIVVDVIVVGGYFTSVQVFYLEEVVLEAVSYYSNHDIKKFVHGPWVWELSDYYLKKTLGSLEN